MSEVPPSWTRNPGSWPVAWNSWFPPEWRRVSDQLWSHARKILELKYGRSLLDQLTNVMMVPPVEATSKSPGLLLLEMLEEEHDALVRLHESLMKVNTLFKAMEALERNVRELCHAFRLRHTRKLRRSWLSLSPTVGRLRAACEALGWPHSAMLAFQQGVSNIATLIFRAVPPERRRGGELMTNQLRKLVDELPVPEEDIPPTPEEDARINAPLLRGAPNYYELVLRTYMPKAVRSMVMDVNEDGTSCPHMLLEGDRTSMPTLVAFVRKYIHEFRVTISVDRQ